MNQYQILRYPIFRHSHLGGSYLRTRWTALEDFINITARKSVKQGRSFSTKVVPAVIASFFSSSRFKPPLEVLRILRNVWIHFVQPQDLHQSSAAGIILWSSTLASPHQPFDGRSSIQDAMPVITKPSGLWFCSFRTSSFNHQAVRHRSFQDPSPKREAIREALRLGSPGFVPWWGQETEEKTRKDL